jgi:hypothetical protein
MKIRHLTREGAPAFPPTWQEPYTGSEPLRDDPLAGILVAVEWGRANLSIELTNYWRGKRLRGRLVVDDASVLPRVHALLSASTPLHVDEVLELEIPPPDSARLRETVKPPAKVLAPPPGADRRDASPAPVDAGVIAKVASLDPDLAAVVVALVAKGLLTSEDLEAARRAIRNGAVESRNGIHPEVPAPAPPLAEPGLTSPPLRGPRK